MPDIGDYLKDAGALTEARLQKLMNVMCEPGLLKDAMTYSLMAGGKRLRPALCLMAAEIFGDRMLALDTACALEMIHTYSLIHDDLPAMDDDVLRRGKPTNHVVFGEAYAILAGDGLLNCAFEVMCKNALEDSGLDTIKAMGIIAGASGVKGMVAGQAGDIAFEGKDQNEDVLYYIHARKTAAMITASVLSGAALFHAGPSQLRALETYGSCIGLVFQIVDDILDETGSEAKLGKTPGKDEHAKKQTFARLYGVGKSRQVAAQKTDEALAALACFGDKAVHLKALARYLLDRDR